MADPIKTVGQTTGDGINANFVSFALQIPGTVTAQYMIQGNIQARGPDGNATGSLYALTPTNVGTITAPTAASTTNFLILEAQLTGGTVSMLTSATGYPVPAAGYIAIFQQALQTVDTSPAVNTVWTMPTSW